MAERLTVDHTWHRISNRSKGRVSEQQRCSEKSKPVSQGNLVGTQVSQWPSRTVRGTRRG